MAAELQVQVTPRQAEAIQALRSKEVRSVLYGGAKGGGKSHLLCIWAYQHALSIAAEFNLCPSASPPHVGWLGRKQAVDFVGTTLQTWQRVIPAHRYRICGATDRYPRHICIADRIAIDFGGLDRGEEIRKFNSAEYGFFAIDQAEETTRDDVSVLRGSLRLTLNGKALDYKELYTANPAPCWLKDEFIDRQLPTHRYIRALPSDNRHLPQDYVTTLRRAFGHRPELLRAYLHGEWTGLSAATQLIHEEDILAARHRSCYTSIAKEYVAIDPARFGDDECVILHMLNSEIMQQVVLPYCRSTDVVYVAHRIVVARHGIPVVIEVTGIGGPIADQMRAVGIDVVEYDPSGRADDPERYYNKRAEAWDSVSRMFTAGRLDDESGVAMILMFEDPDRHLISDLSAPQYTFRNGKMLIEPKDDIKKRLGRSPDRGEAYVIGLQAWSSLPETGRSERELTKYRSTNHSRDGLVRTRIPLGAL